jgi:hypothetical protein
MGGLCVLPWPHRHHGVVAQHEPLSGAGVWIAIGRSSATRRRSDQHELRPARRATQLAVGSSCVEARHQPADGLLDMPSMNEDQRYCTASATLPPSECGSPGPEFETPLMLPRRGAPAFSEVGRRIVRWPAPPPAAGMRTSCCRTSNPGVVPGVPRYFTTAMDSVAPALGLRSKLRRSLIKIDGNPITPTAWGRPGAASGRRARAV